MRERRGPRQLLIAEVVEDGVGTRRTASATMIDVDEEVLRGGIANPGAVIRIGPTVTRPASVHAPSIHRFLEHLATEGFEAPRPLQPVANQRETLLFVPGQVPIPPYPRWALTNEALESIGTMLRRFHDASRSFGFDGMGWPADLRDPAEAELVCHNDVCLENVVFRDGRAVALLDFDFVAPGRAIWDLAMAAGMCVPIRPPEDPLPGQSDFDPFDRLARLARAYGLPASSAEELVDSIDQAKTMGAAFVQRHVDAGDEGFVQMVASWEPGAPEGRLAWFRRNRALFVSTLEAALDD